MSVRNKIYTSMINILRNLTLLFYFLSDFQKYNFFFNEIILKLMYITQSV